MVPKFICHQGEHRVVAITNELINVFPLGFVMVHTTLMVRGPKAIEPVFALSCIAGTNILKDIFNFVYVGAGRWYFMMPPSGLFALVPKVMLAIKVQSVGCPRWVARWIGTTRELMVPQDGPLRKVEAQVWSPLVDWLFL